MAMDPNVDPFAPPPQFMPPPPQQQNYVNPPPPFPPQFPPSGNAWTGAGGAAGGGVDLAPPPNWSSFTNMVNSPAALPPTGGDINQPMPAAAAAAGTSSSYGSGSIPEQEFEAESGGNGGGGGGMGGGQTYNPPPAFGVQPRGYYGSQQSSLLDAYYTGRPRHYGPSYNTNNNGIFGGLFGNSPGGNLFGALMLNEYIF